LSRFDQVLGPEVGQIEAFHVIAKGVTNDVYEGYNGAILAYGQVRTSPGHQPARMSAHVPDFDV
jgi:hypothetical protein